MTHREQMQRLQRELALGIAEDYCNRLDSGATPEEAQDAIEREWYGLVSVWPIAHGLNVARYALALEVGS